MSSPPLMLLLLAWLCAAAAGSQARAGVTPLPVPSEQAPAESGARSAPSPYLPGREDDSRVARIVFRLATAGVPRCARTEATFGLVLQHLSQFTRGDRPGLIATLPLDRGPGVIAVVPTSPAAVAGVRPGDILVAIDGTAIPPEPGLSQPFQAQRAHARDDAIYDLLRATTPVTVALLRRGATVSMRIAPIAACPSQVHLARSNQRNAYADGRHVFLTTGILALLRNDDELAFIIAHEMAHNILGHATIMRGGAVKQGLGRTFGRSGEIVRGTESAADALGAELMLDAGFDPVRGCAILTRLGSDLGIALLATHEPAAKRVAAVFAIARARDGR